MVAIKKRLFKYKKIIYVQLSIFIKDEFVENAKPYVHNCVD